jgi:endonuclease/exonuclease/phosphatase family metal-dependent hydrolase
MAADAGHLQRPQGQLQRQLPCDVATSLERSAVDISAMARYARSLDADVVALQEVDGAPAARQLFPDFDFCFTGSRALQNTGFAIRRGVPYRCGPDLMALSLGDSVRRGATVALYPGTRHEIRLLGVHLKSGCPRQPLDHGPAACAKLARQVPVLEDWIDAAARAGALYAVLGDFNRNLLGERGAARAANGEQRNVWAELNDGEPRGATLINPAAGEPFRNCASGQNHTGFIDQIVLGEQLASLLAPGSFERLTWDARDAARFKLSDHCPIAIRLKIPVAN